MNWIWACNCGRQTPCQPEDQRLGAVWHCDQCGKHWGCVRPRGGGKVWIEISDSDAAFHRLFEEPEEKMT